MKKIRVNISKWAHGGYAIAHSEGKPVFITGGLPGEEVDITIEKEDKKVSFGKVATIHNSSPDRIESDCVLFGDCGGCSYRHISYEYELDLKEKLLRELFPNWKGKITKIFGEPTEYRNNVQWQIEDGKFGFFGRFSHNLLEVKDSCPNLPKSLQPESLKNIFSNLSPKIKKLEVRQSSDISKNQFNVTNSFKKESVISVGETLFKIPPQGFFQINTKLIQPWLSEIKKYVGRVDSCLELFCGVGLIGIGLGISWKEYFGFELSASNIEYAKTNATENKQGNMNFSQRDLYTQTIPKEAWNLETWIVNPPRSGLNPLLIDQVQTLKPKSIIYSSCNPQTLKRDFELLQKFGYQIREMSLVDFFPRTHHYEVLLNLSL